ncbi:hypothetical protein L486_07528 [Kwoniella mangroviensis CBS 10435]|uniref:Uncharacterized protein n=1 Tax=Kwoniella mangroviensis CBS 10435 TaxID=1331196 RepID=A0A1B9IHA8_9TREE|nr:hypothetical protein L486_07528 [Kwoniella mangroviensis CBS 10435]
MEKELSASTKNSPWISTSTDFKRAIWEIARRLSKLNRLEVKLTLIRRNKKYSGLYKGTKSIQIDPVDYLVKYTGEQVKTAMDFAKSASEVLYYGRIFDKDVLESTIWTRYSTPFDLPEYCYIPKKYWTSGESWLDRLVWNPRMDSFYDADEMMSDRDGQIASSRQPSRR